MSLKGFYDGLYEYEKTVDIETIEAFAMCVLRNLTREELRKTVKEKAFEKTLDVGCGIGYNLIVLLTSANIDYVIGVDVASSAVRIAKKRITKRGLKDKSDFIVCDAQFLPLKESVFDLIVCTEVLEHLYDDVKGVSEISRVARANGRVFLSVPSAKNSLRKYMAKVPTKTVQSSNEIISKGYFGLQTGGDIRTYQVEDLAELLRANKIRIVRQWFNGRFFYSLSVGLNSFILSLVQKLLKIDDIRGDALKESVTDLKDSQKIRRLLRLYSRTVIPVSNAILSLDLLFLRFDYGGNLAIEARLFN